MFLKIEIRKKKKEKRKKHNFKRHNIFKNKVNKNNVHSLITSLNNLHKCYLVLKIFI